MICEPNHNLYSTRNCTHLEIKYFKQSDSFCETLEKNFFVGNLPKLFDKCSNLSWKLLCWGNGCNGNYECQKGRAAMIQIRFPDPPKEVSSWVTWLLWYMVCSISNNEHWSIPNFQYWSIIECYWPKLQYMSKFENYQNPYCWLITVMLIDNSHFQTFVNISDICQWLLWWRWHLQCGCRWSSASAWAPLSLNRLFKIKFRRGIIKTYPVNITNSRYWIVYSIMYTFVYLIDLP